MDPRSIDSVPVARVQAWVRTASKLGASVQIPSQRPVAA